VKVEVFTRGIERWTPTLGGPPRHAPLAVHCLTLVPDQRKTTVWPLVTVSRSALNVRAAGVLTARASGAAASSAEATSVEIRRRRLEAREFMDAHSERTSVEVSFATEVEPRERSGTEPRRGSQPAVNCITLFSRQARSEKPRTFSG
jgi:hypothetical protein